MATNRFTRKQRFILAMAALVSLTAVEIIALFMGINGQLLTIFVAAVSAIGGFAIRGVTSVQSGD